MKIYKPRPGSLAAQAIEVLVDGPLRSTDLTAKLKADRRAVFMCLKAAIKHAALTLTSENVEGKAGRPETYYSLPDWKDTDVDDAPPVRVIVHGPGQLPVGPAFEARCSRR